MKTYTLSLVADQTLARDLSTLVARDRVTTADLLAHVAEFDERKLYLPAAYPSMFAYCVGELRMSEDCAAKRIQAARVARRFPAVFGMLADGRLHLTGVGQLAPHLREETADELLAAATHKTKAQIEQLLAERFPRPDVLAWVEAIPDSPATPSTGQHAPAHADERLSPAGVAGGSQHAPAHVQFQLPPGPAGDRPRVKPLGSQSFAVQFTLSRGGHHRLRQAQALLGHEIPDGDIAAVFERALEVLVPHLEKRKLSATDRPRASHHRPREGSRHVPAHVRRAVWERDGGRCTFVSETGHRCEARGPLEFDHIEAYARGGEATVSGIRLRCRAHNQYGAERTFGPEFMRHKRLAAAGVRAARAAAKARAMAVRAGASTIQQVATAHAAAERVAATGAAAAAQPAHEPDVTPWLRALGFSAAEARRAAERCEDIPNASLEERVRIALSSIRVRGTRVERPVRALEPAASLAGVTAGRDGP